MPNMTQTANAPDSQTAEVLDIIIKSGTIGNSKLITKPKRKGFSENNCWCRRGKFNFNEPPQFNENIGREIHLYSPLKQKMGKHLVLD